MIAYLHNSIKEKKKKEKKMSTLTNSVTYLHAMDALGLEHLADPV